jgi:hypothetical protein
MSRFLYQMHIMWYEMEMLPETLESLSKAIEVSSTPVDIHICFNKQTYLEKPIINNINEQFDAVAKHPVLRNATIIEKTDADNFYNIGDWRREVRTKDGYTIWGESDTLIPIIYFPILEQLWNIRDQLSNPHVVTLASRKMWDSSWTPVEHPLIKQYTPYPNGKTNAPEPLSHDQYITQEQLDQFNSQFDSDVGLEVIFPPKIDGSMLALHPNLPQIIADDIHLPSEDFCAQLALMVLNIPQYHITNIIKGHNYHHPRKRTNTMANRNEYGEVVRGGELFDKLKYESNIARERFIGRLINA